MDHLTHFYSQVNSTLESVDMFLFVVVFLLLVCIDIDIIS